MLVVHRGKFGTYLYANLTRYMSDHPTVAIQPIGGLTCPHAY